MRSPESCLPSFSIAIAAAGAAVGLALVISIYRHYKTVNLDDVDSLKG